MCVSIIWPCVPAGQQNTRLVWQTEGRKHSFHCNNEPQKHGKPDRERWLLLVVAMVVNVGWREAEVKGHASSVYSALTIRSVYVNAHFIASTLCPKWRMNEWCRSNLDMDIDPFTNINFRSFSFTSNMIQQDSWRTVEKHLYNQSNCPYYFNLVEGNVEGLAWGKNTSSTC